MSADGAINAAQDNSMAAPSVSTGVPEVVRYRHSGMFKPGNDPRRNLKGGRPRKLREIEKLLNTEHRNIEKMREVFERLRALAMGEVIIVPVVTAAGTMELTAKVDADPAFMKLYLERVMGLPRAFDDEVDFSDAPTEFLEYIKRKLLSGG